MMRYAADDVEEKITTLGLMPIITTRVYIFTREDINIDIAAISFLYFEAEEKWKFATACQPQYHSTHAFSLHTKATQLLRFSYRAASRKNALGRRHSHLRTKILDSITLMKAAIS